MGEETGLDRALTAKGWLTEEERRYLYWVARDIGIAGTVYNIGIEHGASVVCLAEGAHDLVNIVALDIDISKWPYGHKYKNVFIKEVDSSEFVKELIVSQEHPFIDVLFIDGDHSYDGVWKDIYWTLLVRLGGIAIFHDCYDWLTIPEKNVHQVCPGVNQAVEEWNSPKREEWEEQPHVDTMRVFRRTE